MSFSKTSHTTSIEGELTVAVKASLNGKPILAKPIESSFTRLSIASLILLEVHSSMLLSSVSYTHLTLPTILLE